MANKQPKKTTDSKGKKPAFNFYWIYAIIAVILISINLFNWDGGVREITQQEFTTEMLKQNQVENKQCRKNNALSAILI